MEKIGTEELLLVLGRLTGSLTRDEKRREIIALLMDPPPGGDRIGAYLVLLRDQLTWLLRDGGVEKPPSDERLLQIRRAHASARPTAENPAWLNSHRDMAYVLSYLDALPKEPPP